MSWGYALVWLFTACMAASAVWALVWALQHGQMEEFAEGARSIFDADEPEGRPSDAFPLGGREGDDDG